MQRKLQISFEKPNSHNNSITKTKNRRDSLIRESRLFLFAVFYSPFLIIK